MNITIKENYNFNAEWVASKTEADFIKHEKHHLKSDKNPDGLTEEELKEVHKLAVEAVKNKLTAKAIVEKPVIQPAENAVAPVEKV